MSETSKIIPVDTLDQPVTQSLAFGAALQLYWAIRYADERTLIVSVPRRLNSQDDEITLETADNQLLVTARSSQDGWPDFFGRNRKHIAVFLDSFEHIKSTATEKDIMHWQDEIALLKEKLFGEAGQIADDAMEIGRAKHFSSGTMSATYTIIALNTILYLLIALSGASFFKPTSLELLHWGGNLPILTFGQEWWRLITNMFVHSGIVHLAGNMIALFVAGSFLEPMLGKTRYITAYICSGTIASLVSVLWHRDEMTVSAGASGAVFGLFGMSLALLATRLIPKQISRTLLATTLGFVVYNLLRGLKPNSGIDHAAHLGGLFAGLFIAFVYSFTLKNSSFRKTRIVISLLLTGVAAISFVILQQNRVQVWQVDYKTGDFYIKEEKELALDTEKFSRTQEHFSVLEELAIEAMQRPDSLSKEKYLLRLRKTALIDWTECVNLIDESEQLSLPAYLQEMRINLRTYAEQRIQQTILYIKATEEETDRYDQSIDSLQHLILTIVEKMKEKNIPQTDPEPRDM